jgi:hypothetical protein
MEPTTEIRRLLDLMPASGRMLTKVISKREQTKVIDYAFPLPWQQERRISINFDLWRRLPQPQRDLLLLRTVSWLTAVKWFKPDIYQGVVLAGILGAAVEVVQGDVVGTVAAGALTAIAATRIWRNNRSSQAEVEADEAAVRVAGRRGYSETEAAKHLLSAIQAVAQMEGRPTLNFLELLRTQNLQAIAGLSPVGMPETLREKQ